MKRAFGGAVLVVAGIAAFIEAAAHGPEYGLGRAVGVGFFFRPKVLLHGHLSQTPNDLLRIGGWGARDLRCAADRRGADGLLGSGAERRLIARATLLVSPSPPSTATGSAVGLTSRAVAYASWALNQAESLSRNVARTRANWATRWPLAPEGCGNPRQQRRASSAPLSISNPSAVSTALPSGITTAPGTSRSSGPNPLMIIFDKKGLVMGGTDPV